MDNLTRLKSGKFNTLRQSKQADGSYIITLDDRKDNKTYKLRVKDLYKETESEFNLATGKPLSERIDI